MPCRKPLLPGANSVCVCLAGPLPFRLDNPDSCNLQAMQGAKQMVLLAQGTAGGRQRTFEFLLVLDEADDFYRTQASLGDCADDGKHQMVAALKDLRALRPLINFEVTATLLAIYFALMKMDKAKYIEYKDIFYIDSSSEYVGTALLTPPEDANANPVFLESGELSGKNCFINHKVESLWDDAMTNVRLIQHHPLAYYS